MAEPLQAVKGMNDILPPDSARWEWVEGVVRALMARYGYANVRTPIVEPTALFVRGLGAVTDIVEKEMYSFVDSMNDDRLTLRPEATAGLVRAAVEHSLLRDGGKRLFYIGPMFRHERPQKGRYRQFHQVGAEAMGYAGPDVDAELILMCRSLWKELGLTEGVDVRLEINSLGQPAERAAHRAALIGHLERHSSVRDEDARRRLHTNPLRVLDTKNPQLQAVVEAAPRMIDFLGAASLAHFDALREVLDATGLAYRINPRLVRGKPAPAVGWGMGLERLLLLLEAAGLQPPAARLDVYAVVPDASAVPVAMRLCEALRGAGLSVLMHAAGPDGWGSMKSQFRRADASGARHALIFGADELANGRVGLKALRDLSTPQRSLALDDAARWAAELGTA